MNLLPLLSIGMVLLASPSQAAEQPVDAEAVLRRVAAMTPEGQQQWLREIKARLHRTCDVLLAPDEAAKWKSQYDALLHQKRIPRKTLLELVQETDSREKLAAAIVQRRYLVQAHPSPADTPVALAASPVASPPHVNTVLLAQVAVVSPAHAPVISPSASRVALPRRAIGRLPLDVAGGSPSGAVGVLPLFVTPQQQNAPGTRHYGTVDLLDSMVLVAPHPLLTAAPRDGVSPRRLEPSHLPLEHRLIASLLPKSRVQPVSLGSIAGTIAGGSAAPLLPLPWQPRQFDEVQATAPGELGRRRIENVTRAALAPPAINIVPSAEVPAEPPLLNAGLFVEQVGATASLPARAAAAAADKRPAAPVVDRPPVAPVADKPAVAHVADKPAVARITNKPPVTPVVGKSPVARVPQSTWDSIVASAELPRIASGEPPYRPAVEVNVSELNARIGGYNLALRALEAELDEPRGWSGEQLRRLVDRFTRLVRLRADLAIYCRLVNQRDRWQLVALESPRPVVAQLGRSIYQSRLQAAGTDFHGNEEDRRAELARLDALSRHLAELTD